MQTELSYTVVGLMVEILKNILVELVNLTRISILFLLTEME